jgi:hypothetical protein
LDRVATIRDILDRLGTAASGTIKDVPPARSAVTPALKAAAVTPPGEKKAAEASPSAAESARQPTPPADGMSLDTLREKWPEIVAALRKRNQAAAATAEKSWVLEAFDGRKLTVCCAMPGKFATDRMKESFTHLAAAIQDVCGIAPILVAGAPRQEAPEPVENPKPAAPPSGDDLFSNFMSRFGGVEIDPNQAREPK